MQMQHIFSTLKLISQVKKTKQRGEKKKKSLQSFDPVKKIKKCSNLKHMMSTLRLGRERAGDLCFVYLFIFTADILSHAFLLISFSKSRYNTCIMFWKKWYAGQYVSHPVCHPWGSTLSH